MKLLHKDKNRKYFGIAIVCMLVLQLAVLVWYGTLKSGFHEDELYTYYSSNRTAGLFVEDRTWLQKEQLQNEFVVLEGEQFRYWLVKQVQSWDVHPPFYYYLFHTACSFVSGTFSKWTGIAVNLVGYVLSYVLLALVVYTVATAEKLENKKWEAGKDNGIRQEVDESLLQARNRQAQFLTLLTCGFWGFSSAVISGVMFIRMYQWLTVLILLCLWLHVRAFKREDYRERSFLLPLAVTVFLGFLTQYYYIIFHIFLGAGFCLLLLKKKKIKEIFAYATACAIGLGGAILYYPSSLAHIFRGYRGTEAVSEFGDVSNTWERLRFFYSLFDDYVMNGTLSIWLLVICLLAVTAGYVSKKKKENGAILTESVGLMLFAAAGYFFTISKTALLLGETSNRYQLPVYGIWIFLLLYSVWSLVCRVLPEAYQKKQTRVILAGVLAILLVLMDGFAIKNGRVFFLYENEKEITELARENQDTPVVVFYNEASGDHIWWLADKLMEHDKVYLASQGNSEPIVDEEINTCESLLVYVADHEDEASFLEGLMTQNENLSEYHVVAEKSLWTLYEVQ